MLENEEKIQGEANELLLACKEWRWLQPTETTMDIKEFEDAMKDSEKRRANLNLFIEFIINFID